MAESLGAAVLTLGIDDRQLQAGLTAAEAQARRKGDQIQKALEARRTKVDSNQATVTRLQKEALSADASRAALIRQRIGFIQAENRELLAGAAILRQKQQQNAAITSQLQRQIALSKKQGESIRGGVGNFVSGLTGFGGLSAIGAGLGIAAFLRGSIQSAVELESITKRLTNTLGPNGAAGALSFTRGLSDQLGLSFTTLSTTFGSFTAAASAASVPLETQKGLFAAVSRAAQQLGLSNDEISGSLLALQQVASKGTVQMEELRGQLGERLPIAFAATALGLGKTQTELIALVESGKLTAAEFFPALTKGLNELTKGSTGAPTAAQNFQLLANAWKDLQTEFGTNLLPTVTDGVKGLIDVLGGVSVVADANKIGLGGGFLQNALGLIPEQGAEAVGALRALQAQFGLTAKQARALFTDAVAAEGGRFDAYGRLRISAEDLERALSTLVDRAEKFKAKNKDVNAALLSQKAILGELSNLATKKVAKQSEEATSIRAAQKLYQDTQKDYQRAIDAYIKLQGKGAGTKDLQDAASLVDKVGLNLKAALTQGATAIKDIVVQATDRLTSATVALARLRSSSDGLNQYLAPEAAQAQRDSALRLLRPQFEQAKRQAEALLASQGIASRIQTGSMILNGQTTNFTRPALNIGNLDQIAYGGGRATADGIDQIARFIDSVTAQTQSSRELQTAQNNIVQVNSELVKVSSELKTEIYNLAQKDWAVNVNLGSDGSLQLQGDAFNRALSQ